MDSAQTTCGLSCQEPLARKNDQGSPLGVWRVTCDVPLVENSWGGARKIRMPRFRREEGIRGLLSSSTHFHPHGRCCGPPPCVVYVASVRCCDSEAECCAMTAGGGSSKLPPRPPQPIGRAGGCRHRGAPRSRLRAVAAARACCVRPSPRVLSPGEPWGKTALHPLHPQPPLPTPGPASGGVCL